MAKLIKPLFQNGCKIPKYSTISYTAKRSAFSAAALNLEEKSFEAIPGPLNLPLIGSLWQLLPVIGDCSVLHMDKIGEKYYSKYGSIVKEKVGKYKVVHLFNPEYFEVVSKATLKEPIRTGFYALTEYRETHADKYGSPGIIAVHGESWWKLRRVFQRPISPLKETRDFLPSTDTITKEVVDSLKSGAVIEDFMLIGNRLNMEMVCEMLFDERLHCLDEAALAPGSYLTNLLTRSVELAEGIAEHDRSFFFSKYLKVKTKTLQEMENTLHLVEEFVEGMINKVKSRGRLAEEKCIVAKFMNDPEFPQKELFGIIIDILLGGIHTTAIMSSFLLFHVSKNPGVQAKLKEECKRLLPPGASITTSTLNDAVFTRAVLKETLRLNPIAPYHVRVLSDDLIIEGYRIPKDTVAVVQNAVLCKKERYFKDALKFKPERWIKGSAEYEQINPYLMMPFGLGLRACIARRRAEQNLLVLALRMFSCGEVKWMRDTDLGFITPFMVTPDGPARIMFTRD